MDSKTIKTMLQIFWGYPCFIVYLITHMFQSCPNISEFDDQQPVNLLAL
jgi:hypothetical protein